MIIVNFNLDNSFNQKDYDNMIDNIDFNTLECDCHHVGMKKHAYYTRSILTNNGLIKLVILRVKCPICHKTHAIMPNFIIPYSHILIDDQIKIIKDGYKITSVKSYLSYDDVYRIKNNYNRCFSNIKIIHDYQYLHKICLELIDRIFMQIHICNILLTT